jgi:hypothetical protein
LRVEKLYIDGVLDTMSNDLLSSKEKGFFPTEIEFYRLIPFMPDYYKSSSDLIGLWTILELGYLPSFKRIFISYSFKDRVFANTCYERLTLMGVEARIFEIDSPFSFTKVYMHSVISEIDRMMFIASKNSLTSDACHFELTQCIERIRQSDESERLIVIRLDDYVLAANIHGIIDPERKKNFQFLRDLISLINQYTDPALNLRVIDKLLKEIIEKTLKV